MWVVVVKPMQSAARQTEVYCQFTIANFGPLPADPQRFVKRCHQRSKDIQTVTLRQDHRSMAAKNTWRRCHGIHETAILCRSVKIDAPQVVTKEIHKVRVRKLGGQAVSPVDPRTFSVDQDRRSLSRLRIARGLRAYSHVFSRDKGNSYCCHFERGDY